MHAIFVGYSLVNVIFVHLSKVDICNKSAVLTCCICRGVAKSRAFMGLLTHGWVAPNPFNLASSKLTIQWLAGLITLEGTSAVR